MAGVKNTEADQASLQKPVTGAAPPQSPPVRERRDISGNLPHSTSPGIFVSALEKIITSQRPEKFSQDFMSTILKISGGSSRPIPVMLKKMGFLNADGTPTDLYAKFRSDSSRSAAALDGLKTAFSEMFKRNEYAHRLDEKGINDLVIEITGLSVGDNVLAYITKTFLAIKKYIDLVTVDQSSPISDSVSSVVAGSSSASNFSDSKIGLAYNINIVLPETENIVVYDLIFKSLKANMLDR